MSQEGSAYTGSAATAAASAHRVNLCESECGGTRGNIATHLAH
ncbi:MAG: hypothetical protein JWN45_507 [Acidobacteriaceae bacterium]|nr:hypothetical protein [Acidobacteriaceae bacterium]